jgi:hypothetical protein
VLFFQTTSPDGAWLIAKVQSADPRHGNHVTVALPTAGGRPVQLCDACEVDWTPNGRSLVIRFGAKTVDTPNKTVVVTLEPGTTLPSWPAEGIRTAEDLKTLRIDREMEGWIYPSDRASVYVFTRSTVTRNIYRIPLP